MEVCAGCVRPTNLRQCECQTALPLGAACSVLLLSLHPAANPCTQLPVDTALEDRKEQLKRSGLGRVVMFYFKLPGARVLRACSWGWWLTSMSCPPEPIALAWSSSQHAAHCFHCTCLKEHCPFLHRR